LRGCDGFLYGGSSFTVVRFGVAAAERRATVGRAFEFRMRDDIVVVVSGVAGRLGLGQDPRWRERVVCERWPVRLRVITCELLSLALSRAVHTALRESCKFEKFRHYKAI
jgi:hypothetical protein